MIDLAGLRAAAKHFPSWSLESVMLDWSQLKNFLFCQGTNIPSFWTFGTFHPYTSLVGGRGWGSGGDEEKKCKGLLKKLLLEVCKVRLRWIAHGGKHAASIYCAVVVPLRRDGRYTTRTLAWSTAAHEALRKVGGRYGVCIYNVPRVKLALRWRASEIMQESQVQRSFHSNRNHKSLKWDFKVNFVQKRKKPKVSRLLIRGDIYLHGECSSLCA